MRIEHPTHEMTIRGIVIPTDWDSHGEALRVAILTPGEQQYEVCGTGSGARLLQALREEIEARIRFDDSQDNRRSFTVLSYSIIAAPDGACIIDDVNMNGESAGEPDRIGW